MIRHNRSDVEGATGSATLERGQEVRTVKVQLRPHHAPTILQTVLIDDVESAARWARQIADCIDAGDSDHSSITIMQDLVLLVPVELANVRRQS